MDFIIRECTLQDAEAYTKHCIAHMKEKGIGSSYVHPFPSSLFWDEKEFLKSVLMNWSLPKLSPGWENSWVACKDNKFVGHLDLRCGGIDALKHRMRLGMGVETPYRSNGIGKALLKTAIDWARQQKEISWIDLSVFSDNVAAQNLYLNHGFHITHTIEDAVRVEGEKIDELQMVLKI